MQIETKIIARCIQDKPRRRPRIARRFVPRHSLAITLDWDLTSSEKACLNYLLSKPRNGSTINGVSAGEIGAVFNKTARTGRRWLQGLVAQNYLLIRPGRTRGSLTIMLAPKATQWCQLREADFLPRKKMPKLNKSMLCVPSRTKMSASKDRKIEEDRASEADSLPTNTLLARLAELARKHHGTDEGRHLQIQYLECLTRLKKSEEKKEFFRSG